MKPSKFLLMGTLLVALCTVVPAMAFDPTLSSGDAEIDFSPGPDVLIIEDPGGQEVVVPGNTPPGSGWDIKDLRLAYDSGTDTLYVGVNSYNVVGDVDGDGNPGPQIPAPFGGGNDIGDLGGSETVAVYFDLDMVGPFDNSTSWDVIVGVGNGMLLPDFGVFNFTGAFNPSTNFGTEIPGHEGINPTNPSLASPDFEFSILNFSTLLIDSAKGVPDLVPGAFRVGVFMGSIEDGSIGEDFIYYHQVPSTITTITPTPGAVIEGGTVSLEVTEQNDSEALRGEIGGPLGVTISMPYGFFPAQVEVTQNGAPISASPLGVPADSGDAANPGVLDIGETWSWTRLSDVITTPPNQATFVARGSGIGPIGFPHTFVQDPDEEAQVVVEILSTDVGITANPTSVSCDNPFDLIVTELNDGSAPLTNVSVVVNDGTSDIATLTAPPDSGDIADPGVLNPGETWLWTISGLTIGQTTTFTATGSGDFGGIIVTFPDDLDEQDSVTVSWECLTPDTMVTITASDTSVCEGGDEEVILTVCEGNTGELDLTAVQVVVNDGSSDIATLTAPPDSGDVADPGVLNVGEIWCWDLPVIVNATTTFTATGTGTDPAGNVITYPQFQNEQDEVTVEAQPCGDTSVSITTPDTLVCEGDSVILTVCETNTGLVDLTAVQVVVNDGISDIATLTAPPDSGDIADPGVLNIGEIWCWDLPVIVNATTTFTATGTGTDPAGNVITYPGDPDEQDAITVETEPCGGEGCTPGFWKNNAANWGANAWVGFLPSDSFEAIFGVDVTLRGKGKDTYPNPTLLDALNANGGGINALARHAVAALLNTSSPCVNYAYGDVGALITAVHDAILAGDAAIEALHIELAGFNEAGCPINQHGECSHPI